MLFPTTLALLTGTQSTARRSYIALERDPSQFIMILGIKRMAASSSKKKAPPPRISSSSSSSRSSFFSSSSSSSSASPPSSSSLHKLILGCGSNVVDKYYPVTRFPKEGSKGYFSNENICSSRLVGGVTLNHLAWARRLGAPTGLLALQGTDDNGVQVRETLEALGVDISSIRVSDNYATSVSHIFSSPSGERTIVMAPASTANLEAAKMELEFGSVVRRRASMVTTEISQVPLSGVSFLLQAAQQQSGGGVPALLDVDVSPEVALGPARLGSKEELIACVTNANMVKIAFEAAGELLELLGGGKPDSSLEGLAQQLAVALKTQLCVLTDGRKGLALALGRNKDTSSPVVEPVLVPAIKGISQVDATGAGDSAFGALIATLHAKGSFPTTSEDLRKMGKIAAATGAACVEVQGALPSGRKSAERIAELAPEAQPLVDAGVRLDLGGTTGGGALGADSSSSSVSPSSSKKVLPSLEAYAASINEDLKSIKGLSTSGILTHEKEEKITKVIELIAAAHTTSAKKTHIYTSGIGKSGLVAARLASSLRSISIRASYIPATDFVHGDLGTVARNDVLICFSHSGKTTELIDATRRVRAKGGDVIAVTGDASSPIAQLADVHLHAKISSYEILGKIPSRSIIVSECVTNAIIAAVASATNLTSSRFTDNHPGGAIGKGMGRNPSSSSSSASRP